MKKNGVNYTKDKPKLLTQVDCFIVNARVTYGACQSFSSRSQETLLPQVALRRKILHHLPKWVMKVKPSSATRTLERRANQVQ